ncbi:hypothetical protein V8C86DRAFT_583683 [Haematococcus lacustris]
MQKRVRQLALAVISLVAVQQVAARRLFLRNPAALQIVIMGDSISDVGRRFAVSPNNTVPDPAWYSNGRYSNGPTWPEYLPTFNSSVPVLYTSLAYGGSPACGANRHLTPQKGGGDSADILASNGAAEDLSSAVYSTFYPRGDGALDVFVAPWLDLMIEQLLASTNGSTLPTSINYLDPLWPAAAARATSKGAPIEPFLADQASVSSRTRTLTPDQRGQPAGIHALAPPGQRIVMIEVGADDYLNQLVNVTEGDRNLGLPGLPLQVVDCIKEGALRLIAAGDTRIVLFTIPAIDKLPKVQQFPIVKGWVSKIQTRHNEALRLAAAELSSKFAAQGVYVHVFELGNATNNIINNAFLNNLTDTQHTCLQYGSKAGKVLSKIPLVGQKIGELADKVLGSHPEGKCDNPDGFVFWDAVHPTTRMHALTAEALVADLRQLGWWT